MRANIHPKYFTAAKVVCSCGNSWTTGATLELVRTDLCYKCHPFYTGEQRLIDTEGQVERFLKKLDVRQKHLALEAERQLEPEIVDVPLVRWQFWNASRPVAMLACWRSKVLARKV